MSGPIITPSNAPSPQLAANKGQVVSVRSLPDALQSVSRAVRLQGEVVQQNKDGTTRIRTSEGDIDVTLRGKQLQPGTKVEIDVPAGNPPRNVTVRHAPPTPQVPQTQTPPNTAQPPATKPASGQPPAPQTGGTAQPSSGQAAGNAQANPDLPPSPAPTSSDPSAAAAKPKPALPTSYQPPPQGVPAPSGDLPPLSAGQVVRLSPLPPAQAQSAAQQSPTAPQTIVASQIARASFNADLIAQTAGTDLSKGLIQSLKSLGAQSPQLPILSGTSQTSGAPAPIAITIPAQASSTPIALPDLEAGQGQTLQGPLNAAPSSAGLIQDTGVSPRLFQLDVKILDVKPANVQLLAPGENGVASKPSMFTVQANTGTILPNASPATLTGIVTGFTPQNLPVVTVQWPTGALSQNFVLQFAAGNLEPGSQIVFQPQTQTAQGAATTAAPPKLPLMEASTVWPVLDEMYQTLAQAASQSAQMMARVLPSAGNPAQMGPSALLFVATLRSGDISGWLGDKKIEALTKMGKDSLIARLTTDAGNAMRANADAGSTDWKSYPLPMLWQNEISKVLLHVKNEHDPQDKANKEGSTRFIMDLSLTRMGEVQLDGLLRGKRLDLVVRTELPIGTAMQDAMQTAYARALDGTDIFGELGFQGDLTHAVQVTKRMDKLIASA